MLVTSFFIQLGFSLNTDAQEKEFSLGQLIAIKWGVLGMCSTSLCFSENWKTVIFSRETIKLEKLSGSLEESILSRRGIYIYDVFKEGMIGELEKQRSSILSLLQKGKELTREVNAPEFLKDDVRYVGVLFLL